MHMKNQVSKRMFFTALTSFVFFALQTAPLLAAGDEEATSDPVWVLSYASFILFAGITIVTSIFFSKRRATALDLEAQRKVEKIYNERLKAQRDAERQRKLHGKR
ncbi:MAG: hypothetical protein Q4G03_05290 [Planctomycetia bacterium]|nr:hypothetical protein [Planctomycetia bacterium]